jgi:hypothetical protein
MKEALDTRSSHQLSRMAPAGVGVLREVWLHGVRATGLRLRFSWRQSTSSCKVARDLAQTIEVSLQVRFERSSFLLRAGAACARRRQRQEPGNCLRANTRDKIGLAPELGKGEAG